MSDIPSPISPIMSDDPDWSHLPLDLLTMILTKSEWPEDQIRFGAVCKSWRSALSSSRAQRLLPCRAHWIMDGFCLDTDKGTATTTTRDFFSLDSKKALKLDLPDIAGKSCRFSAHGWLLLAGDDNLLSLLNPLTLAQIPLPPLPLSSARYLTDFTMSSNPTLGGTVATIILIQDKVLVHRIGRDVSWVTLSMLNPSPSYSNNVAFHDGMLYVGITFFDVLSDSDIHGRVLVDSKQWQDICGPDAALMLPSRIPGEFHWLPKKLELSDWCTSIPVLFKPCLW